MDQALPAKPRSPEAGPAPSTAVWLWVGLILALSLALRIALLPHRWVNPDEGAHLMDAKLVLDGLVPIVDFDSRQVFYVYLLAAWERLMGAGLLAARVLPMLLGVGVAGLVFILGRYLVGTRAALVATATYAFLPIAVIWSLNVHLEAVTLVFTSLGYLLLTRALRVRSSARHIGLVGAVFGITYYFRESALAHLMAAVVVLSSLGWRTPRRLAGQLLALLLGFAVVAALTVAFFGRYLSLAELWASSLNPLSLPLRALGLLPPEAGAVDLGSAGDAHQPWGRTGRNLRDAVFLCSFLLIGAAAAFGGRALGWRRIGDDVGLLVLAAWLGFLGLAYGYWVYVFGFHPQYFTEFLPPLVILFGAVASAAAEAWLPPRTAGLALALFLVALAGAFVAGARGALSPLAYLVIVALMFAAAGAGRAGFRRWCIAAGIFAVAAGGVFGLASVVPAGMGRTLRVLVLLLGVAAALVAVLPVRPARADRFAFALLLVLGGSALIAYDHSGQKIGVAYYCVWPRSVLAEVARRVGVSTGPGDEVLSGGVIWALEADRHPFLNISHPLAFPRGMTTEQRRLIDQGLAQHPPRLILLDGYTERTILADSAARERLLDSRYQALGQVSGGRFPVRFFVLRAGAGEVSPPPSATPR